MTKTDPESKRIGLSLDLPTVLAIGIVSFIIKNVLHEAIGHGGACLLVGGLPRILTTAQFDCGCESVGDWGVRFVAAGGTLVNFIAAYIFWYAFRRAKNQTPGVRYFLWFAMSGNFFVAAGYPLFSGISGIGDWIDVVQGFHPIWMWRLILAVSGLGLYLFGVWFSLREMVTLIGNHPAERLVRAFRLTLFPYLAGSFATSLGALLNPIGLFVVFTSAAASFGGNSAFAWMSQMLKTKWFPLRSESYVVIQRSWAWIAIAVVLWVLHFMVLGPGISFYYRSL